MNHQRGTEIAGCSRWAAGTARARLRNSRNVKKELGFTTFCIRSSNPHPAPDPGGCLPWKFLRVQSGARAKG